MTDKHLQILDSATGAELAEIGMELSTPVHACSTCRYMTRSSEAGAYKCGAMGDRYIAIYDLNSDGQCKLWRPCLPVAAPSGQVVRRIAIDVVIVSVVMLIVKLAFGWI